MPTISLIGLLIAFLLPLALGLLLASFVRRFRKNTYVSFLSYSLSNWITLAVLLVIIFPAIGWNLADIGFRGVVNIGEIGLALVSAFISIGWFALNARLKVFEMKRVDFKIGNWKHVVILSFCAPITAAFCEEFFYRGFAITVLRSELGNIWIAGIVSSIIFAFMHIPRYGFGGFVQIGIVGLLLMILFIVTGSIYPGMLMHSVNNFFGFVLVPLFFRKRQDNAITD